MPVLKIAAAVLNPTVGAISANAAMIAAALAEAGGCDLVVTTELALCGYPPEDLVRRHGFVKRIEAAVETLTRLTLQGPALLLGTPWRVEDRLYNTMLLLDGGRIAGMVLKRHLPDYGVFDEQRIFAAAPLQAPIAFRGWRLGIPICEDMWFPDVPAALKQAGAQLLIVPNGSPYEAGKLTRRAGHAAARANETGLSVLYLNQLGGQDELLFDGGAFVAEPGSAPCRIAPEFEAGMIHTEWRLSGDALRCQGKVEIAELDRMEELYRALVLGLGDYIRKNGFPGVVLGLSGGIDSALAAALAVDALGPEQVRAVMMPSPYTSPDSLEDAALCAGMLGISLETVSIEPGMAALTGMVGELPGLAGENVQSRLRGVILMAISNRDGPMVLSTGNKSEMAVGYSTLYGDMCGGFAVLKDVYKTDVFRLCRWRNAHWPNGALGPQGPVMPERIITKPPSAELKPDQTDQDSLPPYEALDAILKGLIEGTGEVEGYSAAEVAAITRMLDRAEYKRHQSPPGVKVTEKAFGRDRRYPITSGFVADA